MTQRPELDAETKARIEAEEAYRAKLRAEQSPPRRKGGCGTLLLWGVGIFLLVGILGQCSGGSDVPSRQSTVDTGTPARAAARWSYDGVGDGTHLIGSAMQPGRYRTREAAPGCYWARLAGTSGESADINANENERGPAIVDISPGDAAFETDDCAPWTTDLSPITASPDAPFTDGKYLVGTDISPGTWQSNNPGDCYWARLSGFGGSSGIITNSNGSGIVTISADDVGFYSHKCGTWTKLND